MPKRKARTPGAKPAAADKRIKIEHDGRFSVGDIVGAKVKGFRIWPGRIISADPLEVQFFGTDDTAVRCEYILPIEDTQLLEEDPSKGPLKKKFSHAMEMLRRVYPNGLDRTVDKKEDENRHDETKRKLYQKYMQQLDNKNAKKQQKLADKKYVKFQEKVKKSLEYLNAIITHLNSANKRLANNQSCDVKKNLDTTFLIYEKNSATYFKLIKYIFDNDLSNTSDCKQYLELFREIINQFQSFKKNKSIPNEYICKFTELINNVNEQDQISQFIFITSSSPKKETVANKARNSSSSTTTGGSSNLSNSAMLEIVANDVR